MTGWTCPTCKTEYDAAVYPDHWRGGGRFEFECEGCCTFEIEVDWDPTFWELKNTVKPIVPE